MLPIPITTNYTLSNYDTFILAHIEILSARLLIILHMAKYSQTFIFSLFSYLSKVNIYKYKTKLH